MFQMVVHGHMVTGHTEIMSGLFNINNYYTFYLKLMLSPFIVCDSMNIFHMKFSDFNYMFSYLEFIGYNN